MVLSLTFLWQNDSKRDGDGNDDSYQDSNGYPYKPRAFVDWSLSAGRLLQCVDRRTGQLIPISKMSR